MITRDDIDDALAGAAGGYTKQSDDEPPGAVDVRIGKARGIVRRFLAELPGEACIAEIREAMGDE